ncbi:MAG: hypothetical protein AB7E47_09865 [Desulfovibrionaceae bacterium]
MNAHPKESRMPDPQDLRGVYARLFACPDGELVLADLRRRGFITASPYVPDSDRTLFNLGRQSLAQHVEHMLRETPARADKENPHA